MAQQGHNGAARALASIRGAGRTFKSGDVDVVALRDATLDIAEGELLVVLGPSGSGKSTLLNLIGGMDRATSGSVVYDGRDLGKMSDRELTAYRRHEVGFVFQFYNLVPTLTALENVEVVTEVASDPMEAAEALRMVGLEHRKGHFPAQMSGGEQQRVAIARAIAGNPRLLLCDEPTGALDVKTSRDVLRLLERFRVEFGRTVVVITHNAAIAGMADRVAHMRDGGISSIHANATRTTVDEVDW